jgi:hypothetical protein
VSVKWTGLDAFYDALRNMPAHLTDEARGIVNAHATAAAKEIRDAYPEWAGPPSYIDGRLVTPEHLREGVEVVTGEHVAYTARAFVINRSPLAYIFENGSANPRQTATHANRGTTAPGHVFIPRAMRRREAMNHALVAMLERNGLKVRGEISLYA